MEKIKSITETTFDLGSHYSSYDGYTITTDKQKIKLGISNGQSCCEDWGYFITEDDLTDFIGADLIDISITDILLKNVDLIDNKWEGDTMFVNINTTAGLLQFVAYNYHNGYYGHEAIVISNQLNYSGIL